MIQPGDTDWNLLEEMIQRLGVEAVRHAVGRIDEGSEEDEEDDGKPLSDRLKAELLADFRSWSGGFDPWDCDEDQVEEYGSCAKDHRYLEQCRVAGHA